MRIAIVLGPFFPVPPILGGAVEKVHISLAEAYAAAGHDVTVISRRYMDLPLEEITRGIRHIRVAAVDRETALLNNLAGDLRYALRVARRLPPSDITITNSFFLPLVLRRRTAGKIYVHVARFPKYQMFLYARADRLQAISEAVAQAIVRQAPWLADKVVSIGYPVPDAYFLSSRAEAKTQTVLFVGRIAREKGVHHLLRAARLLSAAHEPAVGGRWKLRIVGPHEVAQGGDGPAYLDELKRLAEPLGPACEFAGPIFEEQRLIGEYQSASVFVYPSIAEKGEAFGLAPLEAMAAGCAVIVSNLSCFDDYVDDGENALKFDHLCPTPEESLAEKLAHLMADQQSREKTAQNGMLTARRFRTSAIAAKLLDDFALLLGPVAYDKKTNLSG